MTKCGFIKWLFINIWAIFETSEVHKLPLPDNLMTVLKIKSIPGGVVDVSGLKIKNKKRDRHILHKK